MILTLVVLFFSGVVHAWSVDSLFLSGLVNAWSVDSFSLLQFFGLGDDAGGPATITQQPPDSNGTYFGLRMEKTKAVIVVCTQGSHHDFKSFLVYSSTTPVSPCSLTCISTVIL